MSKSQWLCLHRMVGPSLTSKGVFRLLVPCRGGCWKARCSVRSGQLQNLCPWSKPGCGAPAHTGCICKAPAFPILLGDKWNCMKTAGLHTSWVTFCNNIAAFLPLEVFLDWSIYFSYIFYFTGWPGGFIANLVCREKGHGSRLSTLNH